MSAQHVKSQVRPLHFLRKILFVGVWLLVIPGAGIYAQSTDQYVSMLDSVLVLDNDQLAKIKAVCFKTADEIMIIDKEIQSIARSEADSLDKANRISAANERKKEFKSKRDDSVRSLLTPEQQVVYDEKIKPATPAVLHFGMSHDRANCVICVKQ
ncbi:MAG: hypothetical protein JNM00_00625 [Flavobacteriales bacterium]|nr:hypothetical protein [Flavobacteriales bacterium]